MLVIFLQRVRGRGCPNTQLYDLPGRGGRLETGLGEALTARGFTLTGRETVDEFARRKYPIPKRCEIHVGELDWQSDPDNVAALAKLTGWNMTVVRGAGHMLPKDYVGMVLDRWLIGPSDPTQKTKNTENSAIP